MSDVTEITPEYFEDDFDLPKRRHWFFDLIVQLVTTKPLGAIGGFLVLSLVLIAIFAPFIASSGPNEIHEEFIVQQPSRTFWFGTDALARDVFSRIIYGSRVSLTVGLGAVSFSITLATIIGVLSAYIGGIVDTVIQRCVDAMMSFPWLVIMLTVMALLGPGTGNVILALGIAGFAGSSRVIRSAVLAIRESEYILSARATGCKQWIIIIYHILPNVAAPIIVLATLGLGNAILAEASLSFLGFGVPPPAPSWGRMLSGDGLDYMLQAPGLAIFPGLAISIAVFGFNMLGDALRDLLDPKFHGTGRGGK
ncbi:MAG: ABC transporter permease [Deltaproteobacteria bacterium]|nr:ABC transporter permease [Deltaproteobacteria bacterium]MBW2051312.1 ABC transporter permease [Deltaproteobacteria bacterium]MBW2140366.1 ABC transporter permease [Deltaproteobacteria bacterium]